MSSPGKSPTRLIHLVRQCARWADGRQEKGERGHRSSSSSLWYYVRNGHTPVNVLWINKEKERDGRCKIRKMNPKGGNNGCRGETKTVSYAITATAVCGNNSGAAAAAEAGKKQTHTSVKSMSQGMVRCSIPTFFQYLQTGQPPKPPLLSTLSFLFLNVRHLPHQLLYRATCVIEQLHTNVKVRRS